MRQRICVDIDQTDDLDPVAVRWKEAPDPVGRHAAGTEHQTALLRLHRQTRGSSRDRSHHGNVSGHGNAVKRVATLVPRVALPSSRRARPAPLARAGVAFLGLSPGAPGFQTAGSGAADRAAGARSRGSAGSGHVVVGHRADVGVTGEVKRACPLSVQRKPNFS